MLKFFLSIAFNVKQATPLLFLLHFHRKLSLISEKVKRIGPHLEIFEAFNQFRKIPTKDHAVSAATCIQRIVRGWLDRTRLNRLRMKVMYRNVSNM